MRIETITPKKSLNKAFLKHKPLRSEIDLFKNNLINLLNKIDEIEREENQKNHIRDFLRDTYYKDSNEINTKDTKDLVIHLGKTNKDKVGVIIEAKRPSNKNEMISETKPNAKAFQELVLYYLRERIEENNIDIKYCIATNIYEWYIIEASYFEKLFFRNKAFVKEYEQWRDGKKVTKDTNLFYNEIVKPFIDRLDETIPCTYFDIRKYEKMLKNEDKADDKNLIALFKILSSYHLLKVPFANDSNSLNDKFYKELLHIIGLEEAKEGNKNIIRRKKENRNSGSLLENTINAIETEDPLHRIPDISLYGDNKPDRVYNVALELCITWINRILFLKLLEGQLVNYHNGNRDYRFLNIDTIHDFDELFKLFHKVLAVNYNERTEAIIKKYYKVPYLNSSLFEISELEDFVIKINSLDNSEHLEFINNTVLKDIKKKTDKLTTLDYLFKFLDAYDFAGENTADIQEDNKTLINASVLGKVFEKINGYKDGSIFTPGFITMFMCRKSVRLAVIQKFKEKYGWNVDKFEDLKNYLADRKSSKDILEFNALINSLKMCDPAVGSGHFLVSLLNEIIAIKYELGLLADENGIRITDYEITIENDELILTDSNDDIFEYSINNGKPFSKEVQRIQKTLFREKQILIENCLFGVDINPNSVKICRLRLWIELLKNAYYKEETNYSELETLPNIDINIKCGNSLISRFALDFDLKKALKSIKYNIEQYRDFVRAYKNEKNREVKRGLQKIIDTIKNDFKTNIDDPFRSKISKARADVDNILTDLNTKKQWGEKIPKDLKVKLDKATERLAKLEKEKEEILTNVIYKNAFEWRFEFPEVLNNDGGFDGFDIITGNPPYIALQKMQSEQKAFETQNYKTFSKSADIYCLFYEKGIELLKNKGLLSYITSNSWLRTQYGELLRKFIIENSNPISLVNIEDSQIFNEATVESNLIFLSKEPWNKTLQAVSLKNDFDLNLPILDYFIKNSSLIADLPLDGWIIGNDESSALKKKIEYNSKLIKELNLNIYYGLKTGFNDAFYINSEIKDKLILEDSNCSEIIKPAIRGKDISKYNYSLKDVWVIIIKAGWTNSNRGNTEPEEYFKSCYPSIYNHFKHIGDTIKGKGKGLYEREDKGDYWWELRSCVYYNDFEKEKIIWGELSDEQKFAFDNKKLYSNNTIFFMTGSNLKYILSILNSRLSKWYFNQISTSSGMGTNRWLKYKIELLPIKDIAESEQKSFTDLVNEILIAKERNQDTIELEKQIDTLVYKLYQLTDEEVKIIENK